MSAKGLRETEATPPATSLRFEPYDRLVEDRLVPG